MTETQQVQYDRFLSAGFDFEVARTLVERGAWLGTTSMSEQETADVRRYRAERDSRRDPEATDADVPAPDP